QLLPLQQHRLLLSGLRRLPGHVAMIVGLRDLDRQGRAGRARRCALEARARLHGLIVWAIDGDPLRAELLLDLRTELLFQAVRIEGLRTAAPAHQRERRE